MQQAACGRYCIPQVAQHTAQAQRRGRVQGAACLVQYIAYTAQQRVDRLAHTQTITHLLSDIGDGCHYRGHRIVQRGADITQNRSQAHRQNVVDGLADIAQGWFQNRFARICQQDATQPQLRGQRVQQAAFTQQGTCQYFYAFGGVVQGIAQWVRVLGIVDQQAA